MSGLISPIETETQEFGLQLGNSSEFPAVYIDFQSSGLNIQLLLSHCIFKLFLPLKLSILGGRIRSIRQSLSESIGRAGSSRRPVRSAAPAVRPLRSGCVVVHSWPRPAPGRWTSRPDVPVVPRRPPLRRAGPRPAGPASESDKCLARGPGLPTRIRATERERERRRERGRGRGRG